MPLASAPMNRRSTRSSSSSTPSTGKPSASSKASSSSSTSRTGRRPSGRFQSGAASSSNAAVRKPRKGGGANSSSSRRPSSSGSASSSSSGGSSESRPTKLEQRAQQEKPWTKKTKKQQSTTTTSSSDGTQGCNNTTTLAEAMSFDSNVSSLANADNTTSTKRNREDISATPQKSSPPSAGDKAKKPSANATNSNNSDNGSGNGSGNSNGNSNDKKEDEQEQKIRTPSPLDQGPTPYWKAMEERGRGTSPKLTRSAAKKKQAAGFARSVYANGAGGGGDVLFFSPPDQVRNAERERREIRTKEDHRDRRVATARDNLQLMEYDAHGNPLFSTDRLRSPPQKKRNTADDPDDDDDGRMEFFTDLSPDGRADPPSAPTPVRPVEPSDGDSNNGNNGREEYERNLLSEIAELKQMMTMQQQQQQQQSAASAQPATTAENDAETMAAMQDLIAKNEKNVALCAVYEERTRSLQSTVDQLREEMAQTSTAHGDREVELSSRVESLREDCQTKSREIESLSQKLQDSANAVDAEKESLAKRISELETELDDTKTTLHELEWKVGSLEEALQNAKRSKSDVEDRLEESAREKLSLELEKDELQKKIGQITREVDDRLQSNAAELEMAASKTAEFEDRAGQYEAEITRLREENIRASAMIEEQNKAQFEKQLSAAEERNHKLTEELQVTRSELEKLESDAEEIAREAEEQQQEFQTREQQLNATISSLEGKIQRMEATGAESNAEREELEKRLEEAGQELINLRARIEAAQKTIASEQEERSKMVGRLEEFDTMRRELEAAKRQIADLERNNTDSSQVIANLQREKAEANETLSGLKRSFDESKEEVKGLKDDNAVLEDQKKRLESNMSLLQDDKAGLAKRLETFDEREAELLRKLTVMEEKRRCLHNRVIQLSGNMRVFVRVRPVIPAEQAIAKEGTGKRKMATQDEESPFHFPGICDRDLSPSSSTSNSSADDMTKNLIEITEPYKDRGGLSARRKKWRFGFDNVFSPESDQEDVWEGTEPLVQSAIDGFNVCLFAYGQTGSGKTHTMLGTKENEGIIYRAVRTIFQAKTNLEIESKGASTVTVGVEMLEIYNEKLRDLMTKNATEVQMKINSSGDIGVNNIVLEAKTVEEVLHALETAKSRRCVSATNSNAESSRSHLVFTIHFTVKSPNFTRSSKLNICDLAGSERLNKSGSTGVRLEETKKINSSLSSLSNVIESLQSGAPHVPFRDSVLTRLLQDSLVGDSKTLAIVCCNPLSEHFNESLCSIKFGSKCGRVELKAHNQFSA